MVNFDSQDEYINEYLKMEKAHDDYLKTESEYITKEMIEPLIGCKVIRGYVDQDNFEGQPVFSHPFPVLVFQREDGLEMHFVISADDECNQGGRLLQVR